MKKLIIIISLFLAINSINPVLEAQSPKPRAGFTITVTAENAGEGWIYISRRQNGSMADIDSAKITVFPIVLKGKQDVPEMLYLRVTGSNSLVPVFTENSEITVSTDFEDPSLTKVSGSSAHKEYDSYLEGLKTVTSDKEAILKDWKAAQKDGDKEKLSALEIKYDQLDSVENAYNRNYVLSHSSSFVTPYIIRRSMFYTLELADLKKLYSSLNSAVLQSVYALDLKDKIAVLEKVDIGQKFTDIVMPDVNDNTIKLSDFTGKGVILVDFWASWCGPCRRENPNVVKIYNEFHDKGFDIVGVSFDTDGKSWKEAIEKDGLVWHQMSDLKGWNSKAAELYGVASIPHTMLIGKDGTILAKNLRGEELKAKLEEILK
ncbi:MAG: AhpC/TSA family protein [Bacteroidales bacterium]|nr:AhpC/TSA family protein [Bacteroidales bacterium]MCB9013192.1 AhpC/TSA family protein [Bacteroidales bacterium]